MRRSEKSRHPLFENVVYGLALLLVAILIFYGTRNYLARRAQVPPPIANGPTTEPPPLAQTSKPGSATESGVTSIPAVRISGAVRPRRWRVEVPSPAGKKN
jgi:hypothetical protein